MICKNCGKEMPEDKKFCTGCGALLYEQDNIDTVLEPISMPGPKNQFKEEIMGVPCSVGTFIGMMIVFCIPLVNFIMMIVWSFGKKRNKSMKNFARATLILSVIGFIISLLLGLYISANFISFLAFLEGML